MMQQSITGHMLLQHLSFTTAHMITSWSLKTALFWLITQRVVVISYRCFRTNCWRARFKCDGTHAETRFGLSAKWSSPFKLAVGSVQSTTGSRGVRIRGSNAGYSMFWGRVQDYWLPTPLTCSPFTSPTMRHRVPSGFNWALPISEAHEPIFFILDLWRWGK